MSIRKEEKKLKGKKGTEAKIKVEEKSDKKGKKETESEIKVEDNTNKKGKRKGKRKNDPSTEEEEEKILEKKVPELGKKKEALKENVKESLEKLTLEDKEKKEPTKLQKKRKERKEKRLNKLENVEKDVPPSTVKENDDIQIGSQFSVSQARNKNVIIQSDEVVRITDFNISAGGKELFKNASLTINMKQRYGLLGPNGYGKTTLLRHMANRVLFGIPENISILLVQQELESPSDETVVQAVMKADRATKALIEEEERITTLIESEEDSKQIELLSERLKEIYECLHQRNAESAEGKVRKILFGLGFETSAQDRPTKTFSGGWRMRISLAQALFIEPELLLLDEPTNHLDLNAVIWLESYLQKWKKILLVVSHDQDFLDSICTDCFYLEAKKLHHYKGGYYQFKKQHEIHFEQELKKWKLQKKKLEQLRISGLTSKKAEEKTLKHQKSKEQKREGKKNKEFNEVKKEELMERPKLYSVEFCFSSPSDIKEPILNVDDVSFSYANGKKLFEDLNFGLSLKSRVCIVGPNGSGKSTLMKLLTGELEPTLGKIERNRILRVGKYHQHFEDLLPFDKSPVQFIRDEYNIEYQSIRNKLGNFGLVGHAHEIPIKELSGGQKARVVFTALYFMRPHILFLDEPTNHLDIESIEALIIAINEFDGGVICITHDSRLILESNLTLWVVEENNCFVYNEPYEQYKAKILKQVEEFGAHYNKET